MTRSNLIKINKCRACGSENVSLDQFQKSFFLSNLNMVVDLQYGICIDCHYIFQCD